MATPTPKVMDGPQLGDAPKGKRSEEGSAAGASRSGSGEGAAEIESSQEARFPATVRRIVDAIRQLLDIILHLNRHLAEMVGEYGPWVYAILFVIVFCETGLVVTPFLPGDSLLFAAGALAATGGLNILLVMGLLIIAAVLGDTVNYWVGHYCGEGLQHRFPRVVKKEYLDRTHAFFEKYGGKTIIIARFVPIVRTFAPFVAGAGEMSYRRFMMYNVVGGILWVVVCSMAGFFFGNMPIVQKNFSLVILGIIVVSVLPAVFEVAREWRRRKARP